MLGLPRILEVLQSLGITVGIIAEGCHMEEVLFFNRVSSSPQEACNGVKRGIERSEFVPDVKVPAPLLHPWMTR